VWGEWRYSSTTDHSIRFKSLVSEGGVGPRACFDNEEKNNLLSQLGIELWLSSLYPVTVTTEEDMQFSMSGVSVTELLNMQKTSYTCDKPVP
jgi:hypothetical protein